MSSQKAQQRAIFLMMICATLWSVAGIFIKMIPWNGLVIAGWRSLISAGCVVIYLRATKQRLRLNRASLVSGVLSGADLPRLRFRQQAHHRGERHRAPVHRARLHPDFVGDLPAPEIFPRGRDHRVGYDVRNRALLPRPARARQPAGKLRRDLLPASRWPACISSPATPTRRAA